MLDGLFMLLGLSVVMALASFLAGALPLSMSLSQEKLRLISTIGMGVLVGTSLIVIIPEGVEAVYTAELGGHSHGKRTARMVEKSIDVRWGHDKPSIPSVRAHRGVPQVRAVRVTPTVLSSVSPPRVRSDPPALPSPERTTAPEKVPAEDAEHDSEHSPPTFLVGFSLVTGFILMFLVDKLPRHATETLQQPPPTRHIVLNDLSQALLEPSAESGDEESESFLQSLTPSPKQTRSLATTTGLVIHAAADGIAMGASASTSNTKLGLIVFMAIMIHKAPAAFGLTSVLLKQGLSKRAARGHLIIFSLAAPFGALSTFLLVHLLGGGGAAGGDSGQWWTGTLLLFSAGTFLYVAMHAMQEDSTIHEHSHSSSNGYADGGPTSQRKQPRPQMRDTMAAVAGMLLPLITQVGHHH